MLRGMNRDGARMTLVIILLVATLLVTAWMAMRAQYAARAHRVTAENVVRDWTRVAADELARRAENQASYYGVYRVLQAIEAAPVLPTPSDLQRAAKTPIDQRNARLVASTFRYERGQPFADAQLGAALEKILAHPPSPDAQEPIWIGERVYVYMLPSSEHRIDGFEVDRAALGPFFELAMMMRPLLPAALAHGEIGNDAIAARAVDPHGRILYATRAPIDPELFASHRAERGLLRGVTVKTSIARGSAHFIIAGGIARQQPIYVLLLAVTGLLLVTAILQIGRERALTRLRSDFVAGVSHELRTPLTQIRMFVETLRLERIRSDEERARSLAIIDQESRRLAQLVENVLQFSRGERGMLSIARREADVGALVAAAVEAFLPLASAERMPIDTHIEPDAMASVDEDALRQVVLNLLDNAVKYGPAGQTIVVEVARVNGSVRIAVDDEGPGIPPRQRKRIWRRYVRLGRERARAIAGAGIGLAVVAEIVKLHGGRAWCENGPRGGSRFVVELPS
jgi:signal transduction histidine kinase